MDNTLILPPQRVIAALSGNLPKINAASPELSQETYLNIDESLGGTVNAYTTKYGTEARQALKPS
jgi:hypothetical protein